MKITFENREWDIDLHAITLRQGVAIHFAYGLNVNEILSGLPQLDPRCYHAAYWIMRQQAGDKVSLDDVADASLVDFAAAFNDARLSAREQRDYEQAQAQEGTAAAGHQPPAGRSSVTDVRYPDGYDPGARPAAADRGTHRVLTQPLPRLRRQYLFGLAHLAGLSPPEQDDLALGDYAALIDDVDEHIRIMSKGA